MARTHTVSIRLAFILVIVVGLASGLFPNRAGLRSEAQEEVRTVVFRQGVDGYRGCTDTFISEFDPHTNYGDAELMIGEKGRLGVLIRFDVSSIPANATVQEATLGLYVHNYGQREGAINAAAYQVRRAWEEMEATWYAATHSDDWAVPGCNGTVTDRYPTPLDEESIYTRDQWYTWDVTSATQGWVQNPGSNKGVVIQQTNTAVGGEFDIWHSEYLGPTVRPYLQVKYTLVPPSPTRTPTSPGPATPTEPPPLPCVGTPEPGAVLAVLQQGVDYGGAEDTWLDFDARDTRYAGEWYMRVGYKRHFSGLIKFDVSPIPQGSRIVCAALSLFAEMWSGGPLDVGAHYVKRENSISQATWNRATDIIPWQMGGCNGPDDRLQTPESTVQIHTIYKWFNLDLTRAVDGWVNGSLPNHGVSLQATDELDTDTVWFTASDDQVVANRPKLVVLYVPPPGAEPTRTKTPTATPIPTATPTATPTLPAGATDTFQNGQGGYSGCSDTRISAQATSSSFEASELRVGAEQSSAALVRFDLASIPSDATVESASLQLYAYESEASSGFDVEVYAVRRPWVDAEANWNVATASLPWGVPGCTSSFSDRALAPSDKVAAGAAGWYAWSVRDDVQRMVSEPGTNAGWMLRQSTAAPGMLSFYSSEHEGGSYRPKLVVTYTVP